MDRKQSESLAFGLMAGHFNPRTMSQDCIDEMFDRKRKNDKVAFRYLLHYASPDRLSNLWAKYEAMRDREPTLQRLYKLFIAYEKGSIK